MICRQTVVVASILRTDPPAPKPRAVPNSERIQAIRDADAAAGENLQMAPAAWQDRRDLLTYVDATINPLLEALKVTLTYAEYWTNGGERLYNRAVNLVSQLEGTEFDPVAYSTTVERIIKDLSLNRPYEDGEPRI